MALKFWPEQLKDWNCYLPGRQEGVDTGKCRGTRVQLKGTENKVPTKYPGKIFTLANKVLSLQDTG